ncbi:MAG: ABC transporter permease [Alistipes shahii]
MAAYLAACIAMGIAVSTLFRYRENSLLLLLWTSIPVLMLSGVSYPREGIPDWLFNFGQLFPSSHGVNGFIRIQTHGRIAQRGVRRNRMAHASSRSSTAGWPASAFTR